MNRIAYLDEMRAKRGAKRDAAKPPEPVFGPWQIQRFEESCGKLWRWEVRVAEGIRESRRIEVRRL